MLYTDFALVVEALNEENLQEAGLQNCETVAICIGEQVDVSILTTMLVIRMGIPHVISKATSREHGEVLKQLGATVVYPEADMAVTLDRVFSGKLLDFIYLNNEVEIRRIQIDSGILGSTVQEIDARRKYGINIIAIERDRQTQVDFSPQFCFQSGDIITVIGKVDNIDRFESDIQA